MLRLMAITVAALAASPAVATAQTGPGIAVGSVTQGWNKVRVHYAVDAPARISLRVIRPGGQTIVVDRANAQKGTLVWNRKIRFHHVRPGSYRLQVVATNASGASSTFIRMELKLVYFLGPARVVRGKGAVLRYALAARARVRLYVKRPGHRAVLVERRRGHRGHNRVTWDFLIGGRPAPAGRYVLLLRAFS